jgi:hypothetical protein
LFPLKISSVAGWMGLVRQQNNRWPSNISVAKGIGTAVLGSMRIDVAGIRGTAAAVAVAVEAVAVAVAVEAVVVVAGVAEDDVFLSAARDVKQALSGSVTS